MFHRPGNLLSDHDGQVSLTAGRVNFSHREHAISEAIAKSSAVADFNIDGTFISANESFCRITGYSEGELVGQHHRVLVKPEEADAQEYSLLWERLRGGEFIKALRRRVASDGRDVWLQAIYHPVISSSGQIISILKIATDVTLEQQRVFGYKDIYGALSRSTALLEMSLDGNIISANEIFLELMGYGALDVLGRHHRMFVDPAEAAAPGYASLWKRLRAGEFVRSEFRRLGANGREIWLLASYNPVTDSGSRPYKILKIASDITSSVQKRTQTALLAITDKLTGLANRRAFDDAWEREIRRAERTEMPLSLVMVDVDNFKMYNDRYGHQAGDKCLVAVARTIGEMARRAGDIAARYGGEEFAIILPGTDMVAAVEFAEALRRAIEMDGLIHEDNAPYGLLTISAGIASHTMAASLPQRAAEGLLETADQALFAAKRAGRNQVFCADGSAAARPVVDLVAEAHPDENAAVSNCTQCFKSG